MKNFSKRGLVACVSLVGVLVTGTSTASATPTTLIYINSSAGDLYSYDPSNSYAQTGIALSTGAFSISSGPAANTIYIQSGSGLLSTYNLMSNVQSGGVGFVPGNALGEGRDGFLYAGSGTDLYRVSPVTGVSTLIGSGTNGYAGDLAVDPTSLTDLYGAVDAPGGGVSLVKVNKATGAQSTPLSFGLPSGTSIFGLGFALDGTLYAAGPIAGGGEIYTVNKTTGLANAVHMVTYQPFDMATQPFAVNESTVPEPNALALVALGFAALAFSRRKKA